MSRFTRYTHTITCPTDECDGAVTLECTREPRTHHEPGGDTWDVLATTCGCEVDTVTDAMIEAFWADLAEEADAGDPMAP